MSAEKNKALQAVVAAAKNMNELIDYSADSVVSKTILDKTVGTVTLFAFDQGQSLSEHTAPYDAIVQVIDGQGEMTIGGDNVTVKAGEIVIMPGNVPHSVQAKERFKMLLIMIRA